jgi:hypothetical protein
MEYRKTDSSLGVIGLVCGILALLSCGTLVPLSLIGLLLSVAGLFSNRRDPAILGTVLNSFLFFPWVAIFIGISKVASDDKPASKPEPSSPFDWDGPMFYGGLAIVVVGFFWYFRKEIVSELKGGKRQKRRPRPNRS